ncbi:hypothetical protein FGO68_gene17178 [Halteria grandinella]|uniref:Uncharacterized protein n=1 Tax=Halteria grandinella TaxID=5974 RepID=A0A8J8NPK9_HALGN|nr:hypothetical protein FGO68_gene17178 [Halteria grandinella]
MQRLRQTQAEISRLQTIPQIAEQEYCTEEQKMGEAGRLYLDIFAYGGNQFEASASLLLSDFPSNEELKAYTLQQNILYELQEVCYSCLNSKPICKKIYLLTGGRRQRLSVKESLCLMKISNLEQVLYKLNFATSTQVNTLHELGALYSYQPAMGTQSNSRTFK